MRPPRREPKPGRPVAQRERGGAGFAARWRAFREATDRYRLLRDVVGALVLVGIVLGVAMIATGGKWPPVVVVESGSMMHAAHETPYGRFGTIDVGDILILRDVDSADEIETWAEGGESRYGRPGHVIAYAANGNRANASMPIVIHRAIAWLEVTKDPAGRNLEYALHWVDGEVVRFGPQGVYFPPLGFDESNGFTRELGYRTDFSGFLTKGDNAYTNPAVDQALGISQPVDPSWIEGTLHGEIPWMGLGKLALQVGRTNPEVPGWERVGNAFAPVELWSMFFLVTALTVLVPFTLDTWRALRRDRERRAFEKKAREEAKALKRERAARRREPVAFTAVPSTAAPSALPPPAASSQARGGTVRQPPG